MAVFATMSFTQVARGLVVDRHAAVAVLVFAWIHLHALPACASERRGLGLNWVRLAGAEQCLTAAQLATRIEASVGRVLFVRAGEAELSIDGYVRAVDAPRGFQVTFQFGLVDRQIVGRREVFLEGSNCSVIDSSVGLLTKVMLDPHGTFDSGDPLDPEVEKILTELFKDTMDPNPEKLPAAGSTGQRAPELAPPPPPPPPRTPVPPPSSKSDVAAFDVVAVGDLGQLPGLGLGVGLHATLESSRWIAELGLASYPQRIADAASGQAGFELQLGSLAICPLRLLGMLALCAGGEYGRMGVSPKNFRQNDGSSSRAIVDVLGAGVLRVKLAGALFFRAAATLAVPLLGNEYVYETQTGDRQLFRTSPVTGRAELGLGVHL